LKDLKTTEERLVKLLKERDDIYKIYSKCIHPDVDIIKKINSVNREITNTRININQIKMRELNN